MATAGKSDNSKPVYYGGATVYRPGPTGIATNYYNRPGLYSHQTIAENGYFALLDGRYKVGTSGTWYES